MSLFTAALGGAGRAAQDMTGVWIREESQMNLAAHQAEIDKGKARLVNELRMTADQQQHGQRLEADAAQTAGREASAIRQSDRALSPEVTARMADQAGAIKGAEDRNITRNTNPGDQLVKDGQKTYGNTTPTGAQITDARVRARVAAAPKPKKENEISADDKVRLGVYKDTITQTQKQIDEMLKERRVTRAIETKPDGPEAKQLRARQATIATQQGYINKIIGVDTPAPSVEPPQSASGGRAAQPKDKAEYDKLPSGALYVKDGKTYRKP